MENVQWWRFVGGHHVVATPGNNSGIGRDVIYHVPPKVSFFSAPPSLSIHFFVV